MVRRPASPTRSSRMAVHDPAAPDRAQPWAAAFILYERNFCQGDVTALLDPHIYDDPPVSPRGLMEDPALGADDRTPGDSRPANHITKSAQDNMASDDNAGQAKMSGAQVLTLKTGPARPLQIARDVWRLYGWEDDGANVIFPAQFRNPPRMAEQGPVNAV